MNSFFYMRILFYSFFFFFYFLRERKLIAPGAKKQLTSLDVSSIFYRLPIATPRRRGSFTLERQLREDTSTFTQRPYSNSCNWLVLNYTRKLIVFRCVSKGHPQKTCKKTKKNNDFLRLLSTWWLELKSKDITTNATTVATCHRNRQRCTGDENVERL